MNIFAGMSVLQVNLEIDCAAWKLAKCHLPQNIIPGQVPFPINYFSSAVLFSGKAKDCLLGRCKWIFIQCRTAGSKTVDTEVYAMHGCVHLVHLYSAMQHYQYNKCTTHPYAQNMST